MAWTHFTDWLDEGDTITRDQLDELYDAVQERAEAVGFTIDWRPTGSDPGLWNSIECTLSNGVTKISRSLHRTIAGPNGIGANYWQDKTTNADYWVTPLVGGSVPVGTLERQAATDLGFSSGDIDKMFYYNGTYPDNSNFNPYNQNSHWYWNCVRRMVQLLRYPRVPFSNEDNFFKTSDTKTSWTNAVNAFYAASEVSINFNSFPYMSYMRRSRNPDSNGQYLIQGQRTERDLTIYWAGTYKMHFLLYTAINAEHPLEEEIEFDGNTVNFTPAANLTGSNQPFWIEGTYDYTTGAGTFPLYSQNLAFSDSAELDTPTEGDNRISAIRRDGTYASGGVAKYILEPAFTHPYETIP